MSNVALISKDPDDYVGGRPFAQASDQGPGGSSDAQLVAELAYAVEPARFIRVSGELARLSWLWSTLALAEIVALFILQDGSLRHWEWSLGFALYYGVLQWLVVHRKTLAHPIVDAPPEPVVSQPGRWSMSGLGGGAVVIAVVVAILLMSDTEDAGLLIAIQIGVAVGASAASAIAYRRVRAIERRTSATILRLDLRRLRVDGHKASWAERKVISKARFSTEPSES